MCLSCLLCPLDTLKTSNILELHHNTAPHNTIQKKKAIKGFKSQRKGRGGSGGREEIDINTIHETGDRRQETVLCGPLSLAVDPQEHEVPLCEGKIPFLGAQQ